MIAGSGGEKADRSLTGLGLRRLVLAAARFRNRHVNGEGYMRRGWVRGEVTRRQRRRSKRGGGRCLASCKGLLRDRRISGICMSRRLRDSYSGGESEHTSMGDSGSPPENRNRRSSALVGRRHGGRRFLDDEEDDDGVSEEEDGQRSEVWQSFSKSFSEVQNVLDQNRVLIQQVNDNHQSKIPDNMTKNVALIREINGNIGKVASLYSNLSSNFTHVVQERKKQHRSIA